MQKGFTEPRTAQLSLGVARRLNHFINNWKVITTDKWILDCVQGFQIPFSSLPSQERRPNPPISSAEQSSLILAEVNMLLEKGAITSVRNPSDLMSFYSTLFLVPKKGGQMRPVINLKKLNKWVEPQHFKMEGMGTLRELLRGNEWMVKVDLKDAYFTIPIHTDHQPYLRFMVGQEHYQFTCLPFSLSCALWVFTKVMKPIAIFLRARGVRMIVYIDNILLMADTAAQAKSHLEALTFLLTGLGFVINAQKSITTPTQQIEFLGLKVNSVSLHLSLPGEKLHHIRMEVRQHLQRSQVTARQLAQLIGKLHATSQAVLPAPLFYRSLQGDLHRVLNLTNQNYDALVSLSAQALEELIWWQEKLTQWNGKALLCRPQTITITSDASLQGWGAVCNGTRTGGPWSQSEQGMHINCLELLAATLAAKTFLKGQIGQSVLLQLDNQTAVAYINNMGGTVSPQLTDLPLDVGLVQRHNSDCRVHSRSSECCSRCRVQIVDGQGRLEASSQVVPRDQPEVGTPRGGPVCISPVHTTTSLLQLETRPISRGDGCVHPAMGEVQRLCEPPMVPDRESPVASAATTSPSNLSGSGMDSRQGQPWYPILLEMLYDYPQQLPRTLNLFQRTSNVNQMDLLPQLAVWPVSGKNSDVEVFWRQLRSSSLHPGGAKHPEPMTHTSGNGWAGVLNGDEIPFQAPFLM